MVTLISHSPGDTLRVGEEWGRALPGGFVIGLSGDLGAGKTQLVKGIAAGLGFAGRVHSPTFALLNEYEGGRLPLAHLDLYRLSGRNDVISAGLEEWILAPRGITVVEWIERWLEGRAPADTGTHCLRHVQLEILSEAERRIVYEDFGA